MDLEIEGIDKLFSPKKHGINHLDVDITDECNLGCSYCYHGTVPISALKPENRMRPEVKEALTKIIHKEQPRIAFFGGEPLVRFGDIRNIIDNSDCKKWSITSNLTLLNEAKAQYIKDNGGSIHCSIDGAKDAHDAQRYYKDGHESYEQVSKKVPLALEISPGDTARATITPETVHLLFDGIKALHAMGFVRMAFMPVLESEWLEEHWTVYVEQLEKAAWWQMDNPRVYIKNFGDCLRNKKPNGKRCGAGHRLLSVSVDGAIYPCHRFSQQESRGKGEWYLGNINDGDIDSDKLQEFRDRFSDTPDVCKTCPAYNTCSGGCPHVAYSITGEPDGIVPNHCEYMLRGLPVAKKMYNLLKTKDSLNAYVPKRKPIANSGIMQNKHVKRIFEKARQNGKRKHMDEESS